MGKSSLSYAKALFLLDKESQSVAVSKKELGELSAFLSSEDGEELSSFLSSFALPYEKKLKVLSESVLSSLSSKNLISFLKLLLSKSLFSELPHIERDYRTLANEYLGIDEGIVYSVKPLTKEGIEKIEKSLSKKRGNAVELENRIDPKLIGGVRVYVGNELYDQSIEGRVESLRAKLLKGGSL